MTKKTVFCMLVAYKSETAGDYFKAPRFPQQMAESRSAEGPKEYVAVRITAPHSTIQRVIDNVLTEQEWYIIYAHTGEGRDSNEHFHVTVPTGGKNYVGRIRDRIKATYGSGNKFFCIQHRKNGVAQAIQYGSHEGTVPITKGDVDEWIRNAPVWIPGLTSAPKRRKCTKAYDYDGEEIELGPIINQYNVVGFAAHYYKKHGLTHKSWRKTVSDMIGRRRYRWMFKERVDPSYEVFFLIAIGEDPEALTKACTHIMGFDFTAPGNIYVDEQSVL